MDHIDSIMKYKHNTKQPIKDIIKDAEMVEHKPIDRLFPIGEIENHDSNIDIINSATEDEVNLDLTNNI